MPRRRVERDSALHEIGRRPGAFRCFDFKFAAGPATPKTMDRLIAVVGPTGSGKSELALRLAEECRGEIVNCDSLQLYRYLDIGTAKVPPSGRRGIPHHLLDVLDPDQVFTAGEYARAARQVLGEIAGRERLPIVVGGTGFYLRALLEGLFPGPRRDERLRARLTLREQRHPGWLHLVLTRFDPASAAKIHASDVQKAVRAVEVLLLTRRPLSSWFGERRDPLEGFRVLKLGLDPPRQALYDRLDARSERMFAGGLIEEIEQRTVARLSGRKQSARSARIQTRSPGIAWRIDAGGGRGFRQAEYAAVCETPVDLVSKGPGNYVARWIRRRSLRAGGCRYGRARVPGPRRPVKHLRIVFDFSSSI